MNWSLNGVSLPIFNGLSTEVINRLEYKATVCGVACYVDKTMPLGHLELWDGGDIVAVIDGATS